MGVEIRACASVDELRMAVAPIWRYFGVAPTEQALDNFAQLMTPARALIVTDDGAPAAGCGSFPFELTTPGGRVASAGLTMVGVQPTHRRRGLLTQTMRRFVDDTLARGEPTAYLWASEEKIYGRFGFGLTSLSGEVEIARDHAAFLTNEPPLGRVRLAPLSEALAPVRAVYGAVAATRPGMFARSEEWLRRRVLVDLPWQRAGGGELTCALLEIDGLPAAYALYRFNQKMERGISRGSVAVVEAMAVSPAAARAIWRYLLDLDWYATLRAQFIPQDHPLILLAAEPRRLNLTFRDGCWLRLVDVEKALAARSYGPDEVVIELSDAFCPWNAGRWAVGAGGVARTTFEADIWCDAAALASAYLGGFSWRELVAAGRAHVRDEAALARADRAFERRGAPWVPEIF